MAIETVYVTPDARRFVFDGALWRYLVSEAGLGMAEYEYLSQRGPRQDGDTALSFRFNPRLVQFAFRTEDCSEIDYWNMRANIHNFFRPNRQAVGELQPGYLEKRLPIGKRRLDVLPLQGPAFDIDNGNGWDAFAVVDTLRFVANIPFWYDPEQVCQEFVLSSSNNLVFPFIFSVKGGSEAGMLFGSKVLSDQLNITYAGTVYTYPIIQITGPINNPTISNLTTNKTIRLLRNVPGGEVITIRLEYGNKVVTNQLEQNLIGSIENPSDLISFRIEPEPTAPGGVNTLQISGSGANQDTAVEIAFFTRYVGI